MKLLATLPTILLAASMASATSAIETQEVVEFCSSVGEASLTILLQAAEKRDCSAAFFDTVRKSVKKAKDSPSFNKYVIEESRKVCKVYAKRPTQDAKTVEAVGDATVAVVKQCALDIDTLGPIVAEEHAQARYKRLKAQ